MKKILSFSLFFLISLGLVIIISSLFQRLALAYQTSGLLDEQISEAVKKSSKTEIANQESSINFIVEASFSENLLINEFLGGNNLIEFTSIDPVQVGDFKKNNSIHYPIKEAAMNKKIEISLPQSLNNLGETASFSNQKKWLVKNSSSVPGRLLIDLQDIANLENGCNDQEKSVDPQCINPNKEGDLGKIINLQIFVDGKEKARTTLETNQPGKIGRDWLALPAIVLPPRGQVIITAYWAVDESSYGNEIQSDSVEFIISFQLVSVNKNNVESELIVETLPNEILGPTTKIYFDTDNDGLSDTEERQIYHTDPFKADTDGDGYQDNVEVINGYDPNNSAKVKKVY